MRPTPSSASRHAAIVGRLVAAGCVAAEEEARDLASAAPDDETLESWLGRREQGEPLAWIIGMTAFCGHMVRVDGGVYVPRPQTEELARRAADLLPEGGNAVDLCTGSGAIAVHLRATRPAATVVGVDIDMVAAACAWSNGVGVVVADVRADLPLRHGAFDVVTAVAPYVPTAQLHLLPSDVQRHEPRLALDGGDDGVDVIQHIIRAAARLLRPGGSLLIEVGGEQDRVLEAPLHARGYASVSPWFDDEGDLRGLTCLYGSGLANGSPA